MIITQPKELIGAFVNIRQGHRPEAPWGDFNALGLVRDGRLVAGVIYNNYSAKNVYAHIGADQGCKWMTKQFLFAMFDYPFNELGLHRVTALIRATNSRAIEFAENLGFTEEGLMRHYFIDDDAVIYGLLRDKCRFLEMRKAA